MTALNAPLIAKIETHLFDVSRLGSKTFGPVISNGGPGPRDATLCTAAAGVCAQVEIMMDRRLAVFRATPEDQLLLEHVPSAKTSLRFVTRLIDIGASTEALESALEQVFDHLAGSLTVTGRLSTARTRRYAR